jgi:ABC-type sugar transport system permease subunit
MRCVLTIAVLLRFTDSFNIHSEPFVLAGGEPGNATTLLAGAGTLMIIPAALVIYVVRNDIALGRI